MPLRSLLVSLFALGACQSGTSADPPPDAGGEFAASDEVPPDTAMVRETSASHSASLLGDLSRASPSVGIQTIDLWIARLDTAAVPTDIPADVLPEIRGGLQDLKALLQSSPLDGPAIGRTLRQLGEDTAQVASSESNFNSLARALSSAGLRLAPDSSATTTDGMTGPRASVQ